MSEQIEAVQSHTIKPNGIVNIAASLEDLKKFMSQFQKLKTDLLDKDVDIQMINEKPYVKKSGWLKFGLAFNLKTEIIKEEKEWLDAEKQKYAYHFTVRCTADNGRITEKVGSCDNIEKTKASVHVIRSMGETRANNRAISAMVGAGEVSAEEMRDEIKENRSKCLCSDSKKTLKSGICLKCGGI